MSEPILRTSWKTELPQLLLIGAMFALAIITWPSAPERIPVHWNIDGEVDRYGGKLEGLLLLPSLAGGLYLLLRFLPRLDPGRANYKSFANAYTAVRYVAVGTCAAVYAPVLASIYGRPVAVQSVVPVVISLVLLVLGGLFGKIRPNWFVGIRTPWTLSSKTAWVRTHRLAGWLLVATGLLGLAATGVGPRWALGVLIGGAVGTTVFSFVYSYLVWRTDPGKISPAGSLPADSDEASEGPGVGV